MGALETLFSPETVAVVGATDREGSVGRAVTENLLESFDGEVFAVNPGRSSVLGLSCYDEVQAIDDVDLVVVAVPPDLVVEEVRQAATAGVRDFVVLTAGFKEAGSDGAGRERELVAVAEEFDLNLVGPNCLGVISTPRGLNATFAPTMPESGPISFMSQSGAFVTAVLDWASDRHLGFKDVVSVGNKAVLDEVDLVREWGDDPETAVVLGYLEDVDDGRAFVEAAREVTRETPIAVVKSGRTEAGASAAASHTGALAGSERAYQAGLEAAGVIRANTVQELFDVGSMLSGQPLPETEGVAIVTNAGGPGVMATDAVGDADLELAEFSEATVAALDEQLPAGANLYNPVDVVGDAPAERFAVALDTVLADDAVGAAIVVACPVAVVGFDEIAEVIVDAQSTHGVPVAATLMGGTSTREAEERLHEAGIPTYFDPARAVTSLDALVTHATRSRTTRPAPERLSVDRERASQILAAASAEGRTRIGVEAMDLLAAYGIPTPAGEVVDSPEAAEATADRLDGPVVMKIVSPDILHKSDIGGVEVGVAPGDVADTYESLVTRARQYQPDATILGVQVQEQVDVDAGVETIAGLNRDPQFGPLVMFGLGGVFVEVFEDTTVRLAPVAEETAAEMVDEIQAAPLLHGARGREPVDVDAVVDVLRRLGQLAADFPSIVELDINPVLATPDGAVAVDLRLTLDQETQ